MILDGAWLGELQGYSTNYVSLPGTKRCHVLQLGLQGPPQNQDSHFVWHQFNANASFTALSLF